MHGFQDFLLTDCSKGNKEIKSICYLLLSVYFCLTYQRINLTKIGEENQTLNLFRAYILSTSY